MEKSALERYFDKYIADDASHTEEEEEMNEEQDEELFFKLLPDELLESSQAGREHHQDGSQVSECPEESDRSTVMRKLDSMGQKLIPEIKNIVSSVDLGCKLELDYIAANAWNIKYNKRVCTPDQRKFIGLTMTIRKPRASGVFYSTGKMTCLGADSVEKSKVAARRLARIVQKLGFPVRFLKFRVHNMMVDCKTHPIDLERMAAHADCRYEPELCPSLCYSVRPGMSILIQRSGTLTLCGAKNQADIDKAFEKVQPIVNSYQK